MDASNDNVDKHSVNASMLTSDSDVNDDDTSSVGSDTVREVEQLMDASSNDGINDNDSVMIAGEGNTGDWSTVSQRKRKCSKSANGSSSSAGSNAGTNKKTCTVASSRNVPVSDENGLTYRHSFFTIR